MPQFVSFLFPDSYNREQCKLQWNLDNDGPIYRPKNLQMFEFTLHKYEYSNTSVNYGLFGEFEMVCP